MYREHSLVMLATNNRVIGVSTVHASIIRAADVVKPALLANVNAVVVAPNHRGANLEPSQADVAVSKRPKEVPAARARAG